MLQNNQYLFCKAAAAVFVVVLLAVVVLVVFVVVGVAEFSDHGLQSTDECSQRGPGRS